MDGRFPGSSEPDGLDVITITVTDSVNGKCTLMMQGGEIERYLGYCPSERKQRVSLLTQSIQRHVNGFLNQIRDIPDERLIGKEFECLYDNTALGD